jgi:hypothetical protein
MNIDFGNIQKEDLQLVFLVLEEGNYISTLITDFVTLMLGFISKSTMK